MPERFEGLDFDHFFLQPMDGPAREANTAGGRCATASPIRAGDSAFRRISFSAFRDHPAPPTGRLAARHARLFRPHQSRVRLRRQVLRRRGAAGAGMDYLAHPAQRRGHPRPLRLRAGDLVAGILHHVLEETRPSTGRCWSRRSATSSGPSCSPSPGTRWSPSSTAAGRSAPGSRASRSTWHQLGRGRAARARHLRRRRDARLRLDHHRAPAAGGRIPADRLPGRLGTDIWWYRSLLEILEARSDWPRREMLDELRAPEHRPGASLRRSED